MRGTGRIDGKGLRLAIRGQREFLAVMAIKQQRDFCRGIVVNRLLVGQLGDGFRPWECNRERKWLVIFRNAEINDQRPAVGGDEAVDDVVIVPERRFAERRDLVVVHHVAEFVGHDIVAILEPEDALG